MKGDTASLDVASKKNIQELEKIGEKLLEEPVSRVNLEMGIIEPVNFSDSKDVVVHKPNREQLIEFAKKLSEIRKAKQKIKKQVSDVSVSLSKEQLDSTIALSKLI